MLPSVKHEMIDSMGSLSSSSMLGQALAPEVDASVWAEVDVSVWAEVDASVWAEVDALVWAEVISIFSLEL